MEKAGKVGLEGKECVRLFSVFNDSYFSVYPKTTTHVFTGNYIPLFFYGSNKNNFGLLIHDFFVFLQLETGSELLTC